MASRVEDAPKNTCYKYYHYMFIAVNTLFFSHFRAEFEAGLTD